MHERTHKKRQPGFIKYYIKQPDGKRKEKREYFGSKLDAQEKAHQRNDDLKLCGDIAQYEKQGKVAIIPLFKDLATEYHK
jgi:hypothetical protein